MTKEELTELLKELQIPINEGTPEDDMIEEPVRLCFWDYLWETQGASGNTYNTIVTYQISFLADVPRHAKLIELVHKLDKINLHPVVQHEYNNETRRWHSFFSLEVLENV